MEAWYFVAFGNLSSSAGSVNNIATACIFQYVESPILINNSQGINSGSLLFASSHLVIGIVSRIERYRKHLKEFACLNKMGDSIEDVSAVSMFT